MLNISDGIQNLGQLEYPLVLCLLVAWLIVFGALLKGVQSLGKSQFNTEFLIVFLRFFL